MGKLISKPNPSRPRTIAEAKAEISEVLQKIKEHYDAINTLRLADRTKWKYFNKRVEELEVVRESALKQEKKRKRDQERALELNQLEATMLNKGIISPYRTKPSAENKLYVETDGKKSTTSTEEKKSKRKTDSRSTSQEESGIQRLRFRCSKNNLEDQSHVSTAMSISKAGRKEAKFRTNSAELKSSAPKDEAAPKVKSNAKTDELFVQIEMPINVKKDEQRNNSGLRIAKLVSVPMNLDCSESDDSSECSPLSSSSLKKYQYYEDNHGLPPIAGLSSPDHRKDELEEINHGEESIRRNKMQSRSRTKEFIESISLSEEHESLRY